MEPVGIVLIAGMVIIAVAIVVVGFFSKEK
jgi:hypothetical protein